MTAPGIRGGRARPTSDETRLRGVIGAGLAAAVVVAVAALLLAPGGVRGTASPGPLARPHRAAQVTCAACHGPGGHRGGARPPAAACTGCHGAHPSTRAGHRAAVAAGRLACADCHPAHGGPGGVRFLPDGGAIRHDAAGERPADPGGFRPVAAIDVPLVTVGACRRCHDPSTARDPIAACLVAGQEGLGDRRIAVCFDEHAPVRKPDGALAPRAAAWDAAAAVAAAAPPRPARPRRGPGPWSWLGLGAAAGLVAWFATRAAHRRREEIAADTDRPAATAPGPDGHDGRHRLDDGADPGGAAPPALGPGRRLPVIDAATCLGCSACVEACPYDVLEVRRWVAVVARPSDCCGLTLCEQRCPNGSLIMIDGPAPAEPSPVDDRLESRRVPGLYLAGDAAGGALIRSAIDQGARAVATIADRLDRDHPAELDLIIVGAGPAGLSAALEAGARGLRYLALEQGSIADSIRSFPRGKLVLDHDRPTASRLWLAETTKEELVARWLLTVGRERPAVLEGQRVSAVTPGADGFAVEAVDGDGRTTRRRAAHVLIAIGRRGSPRKLDVAIPPAMADHVHYLLTDARSFAGQRVLVVGLGDVAMEAAVALSRQPGTRVTVSYRGDEFRRGKARNIDALRRRVAAGAVRVVWGSQVAALHAGRAVLTTPDGPVEVACDAVFALIGSIPYPDLMAGADPARQTVSDPGASEAVDPVLRAADREEVTP